MDCFTLGGLTVLAVAPSGPPLESERDATDLIGEALGVGADTVVVPATRLSAEFFQLATRKAGLFIQKFANYRMRVVILGDITAATAESRALTDFVHESNRGSVAWFLPDRAALEEKLTSHRL
jgi:hypothetical protein